MAGPLSATLAPTRSQGLAPLLDHIRKAYSLAGVEVTMELGGVRNFNVLVTTGYGMFIVRVHPPSLNLDRLLALQGARRTLAGQGIPCTVVRPTRTGESWTRFEGQLVELGAYVDSTAQMDTWPRLEAGLPLLGRIHAVFRTLSLPSGRRPANAPYPAANEVSEWTNRAVARLRTFPSDPAQERFVESATNLSRLLQKLEDPSRCRFPAQLVHGDFWGRSVLFRNGKVALVTGFDLMTERPRIEDLAWTLYWANRSAPEDRLSGRRIRRLRGLVEDYVRGLGEPLSADERASLPLALARIPLYPMRDLASLARKEDTLAPIEEGQPELEWAIAVLDDLRRWRDGFA